MKKRTAWLVRCIAPSVKRVLKVQGCNKMQAPKTTVKTASCLSARQNTLHWGQNPLKFHPLRSCGLWLSSFFWEPIESALFARGHAWSGGNAVFEGCIFYRKNKLFAQLKKSAAKNVIQPGFWTNVNVRLCDTKRTWKLDFAALRTTFFKHLYNLWILQFSGMLTAACLRPFSACWRPYHTANQSFVCQFWKQKGRVLPRHDTS